MNPRHIPIALCCLSLAACGGESDAEGGAGNQGAKAQSGSSGAGTAGQNPTKMGPERFGLDPEFPLQFEPAQMRQALYDRNRTQALRKLVDNLEGTVSPRAWRFAREYFWRGNSDAVPELIEAMDRALGSPAKRTHLENLVEAMGRMGNQDLAPALLRAAEHPDDGIRNKAIQALVRSGTPEAVKEAFKFFPALNYSGQRSWVKACNLHLGEGAVSYLRTLVYGDPVVVSPEAARGDGVSPALLDLVIEETREMSPERGLAVLGDLWATSGGALKRYLAALKHGSGDLVGTRYLQGLLKDPSPAIVAESLGSLAMGSLEEVLDDVLRLSVHKTSLVRRQVALVLQNETSANATDTLMVLSRDQDWEVRKAALMFLDARGERTDLDRYVAELQTATGPRLSRLLDLFRSIRDGSCAPVLLERYRAAPQQGRAFLQSLAFTKDPKAYPALREIFLAEHEVVFARADGKVESTATYVPRILVNVRGNEEDLVALFLSLDKKDLVRRAAMLDCIGQVAADREDPELRQLIYGELRRVLWDRTEPDEMRLATLIYLQRDIDIKDVTRIRAEFDAESPRMRQMLSDYLHELF